MTHSADYLLQMIRQIAANQPQDFDDSVKAQRIAAHLKRFWAPSMLQDVQAIPKDQLDAVAAQALLILNEPG